MLAMAMGACHKENRPLPVSAALQQQVDTFRLNACPDANIKVYRYAGAAEYVFYPGTCSSGATILIYNADGTLCCMLGGPLGFTDCNGSNFYDHAVYEYDLWH